MHLTCCTHAIFTSLAKRPDMEKLLPRDFISDEEEPWKLLFYPAFHF